MKRGGSLWTSSAGSASAAVSGSSAAASFTSGTAFSTAAFTSGAALPAAAGGNFRKSAARGIIFIGPGEDIFSRKLNYDADPGCSSSYGHIAVISFIADCQDIAFLRYKAAPGLVQAPLLSDIKYYIPSVQDG